jgi:hypothetical protein
VPIEHHIQVVRGKKVMFDADLAHLYGVTTKRLNEAVKRNLARFPETFMFQLTPKEVATMRSQIATASKRNIRYQPLAFTEYGVVMLSSVLNSARAVQVSILVTETFIRLREATSLNKDVLIRVEKLERGHDRTASVIEILVEDIDNLTDEIKQMKALPLSAKRKIGFFIDKD